jgi:hypothetical protein
LIENVLPAAPVHESGLIACVVFGAVFRNAFTVGAVIMPVPRRAVLRHRLIEFGKAAEQGELPFDVLQILGFGSFFRGKESPQDVDLVLRVDRRPERFALFRELIEMLRFTPHYEDAFATPREALLHVCTTKASAIKWPARQPERFIKVYSEWLEGYAWNMLHAKTDADHYALMSPDHFARRLISRRFPKVNVVEFLDEGAEPHVPLHIFHGFEVSIWTKDAPDTAAALDTLQADDVVRRNVIKEIGHFGLQRNCLLDQIALCREEVAVLRDEAVTPPSRLTGDDAAWHAGDPRLAHLAAAAKQSHAASVAFRTSGHIDPELYREMNAADTVTLIAQADDARTTIKALQEPKELWTDLRDQLWRARHEPNIGAVPLDELAAALMLNHGRRSLRPRKQAFLKQQGFPADIDVDDTLLRSRRGY